MKRLLALLLITVMIASLLAGCEKKDEQKNDNDTSTQGGISGDSSGQGTYSGTDNSTGNKENESIVDNNNDKDAGNTDDNEDGGNDTNPEDIIVESKGLAFELNDDGESYKVTGIGTCADTKLVIPAQYEGKSVTSIGDYAFRDCDSLTSIEIPNSVTSIGRYAFVRCDSLTSVEIPNSVTSIGSRAFEECFSLTSVYITDIAKWCGISFENSFANTFYCAKNLYLKNASGKYELVSELVIPDTVTEIKNYAFSGFTGLTSIEISNGVTSIGEEAFRDCTSLTSVKFAENSKLTSIGDDAFCGCYKLVEVINKSSLTIIEGDWDNNGSVGAYALEVHNGDSEIVNKDGYLFYTYDGTNYLLGYANNDTELTLPENYNGQNYEIYKYAFYNNTITSVTIGNSVTSIGEFAFGRCTSLTGIEIPNGVASIGIDAFLGCTNLTSVTIGAGVTSIGARAFEECGKLVEIVDNSSLNIKGSSDYQHVVRFAIEVHSGESKIDSKDGYLFYTYDGTNYLVNYIGTDKDITLPADYNGEDYVINRRAFYYNDSITSVEIPNSVTSIDFYAFVFCDGLTSVKFAENSKLTSIGFDAFDGCNSLTSIEIPNSVTSIDSYAFAGCDSLTSVTFEEDSKLTSIGSSAFYGCTSLTSIEIPNSVTSIGCNAFYGCTSLTSVTFENTEGWWYSSSPTATSGTSISSTDLENLSTAATYLKSTYCNYYWERS